MSVPVARHLGPARRAVPPRVEGPAIRLSDAPPRDWNARITSPTLSQGFAAAAAVSGYHALYVDGGTATALVLVRILPGSLGRACSARAKAYVSRGDATFVSALVHALAARGIAHVWVGDTVEGVPRHTLEQAGILPVMSHRLAHAPALSDRELFERLAPRRRAALRRAELDGIVVSEVRTEAEIEQYCALAAEADSAGAVMPPKFFATMFRAMVPRREAVFFLARRGERAVAGAAFLVSRYRMSCFHSVATRDQDASDLAGPTAVIWHALRVARVRDLPCFDLGAVTLTSARDRTALGSYDFKSEFGGYLEPVCHGEVAPSRLNQLLNVSRPSTWQRSRGEVAADVVAFVPTEITSGIDVQWAGAPTQGATGSPLPFAPWTVEEVAADMSALVPQIQHASFFAMALVQEARRKALAFMRALNADYARDVARPSVTLEASGAIKLSWTPATSANGELVEIVFVRDVIEYSVMDGSDATSSTRWPLLSGQAADAAEVLREVVKRYVLRPKA